MQQISSNFYLENKDELVFSASKKNYIYTHTHTKPVNLFKEVFDIHCELHQLCSGAQL